MSKLIVMEIKDRFAVVLVDIFDAQSLYEGKVDKITKQLMEVIIEALSKRKSK